MAEPNPNKVNQYTLPDPRQNLFFEYFLDRNSDTFSNALRSAVKAGFTEEYGKALLSKMPKWLSDRVKDENLIAKAERNLNEFLDEKEEDKKIKADMTKFALRTLVKEKYSERQELTGKNGEPIIATWQN